MIGEIDYESASIEELKAIIKLLDDRVRYFEVELNKIYIRMMQDIYQGTLSGLYNLSTEIKKELNLTPVFQKFIPDPEKAKSINIQITRMDDKIRVSYSDPDSNRQVKEFDFKTGKVNIVKQEESKSGFFNDLSYDRQFRLRFGPHGPNYKVPELDNLSLDITITKEINDKIMQADSNAYQSNAIHKSPDSKVKSKKLKGAKTDYFDEAYAKIVKKEASIFYQDEPYPE